MPPVPHRIPEAVSARFENLYTRQLSSWDICRQNYAALNDVLRRPFTLGALSGALQYNPARRRSTAAKTDAASIAERPCFLCGGNRPSEQMEVALDERFVILVNPFPIFPLHLTIAARNHEPQASWPDAMITFAEARPGIVAFYNGAKAGASAPDHLHFQAVADCELPIVQLVEQYHTGDMPAIMSSTDFGVALPFGFFSFLVPPTAEGLYVLRKALDVTGYDMKTETLDRDLLNVFVWIDPRGFLRIVAVPRKAHRPDCYFAEGEERHLVSPGAVDMAGIIVLPDKRDFDTLTDDDIRTVYSQTAFTPKEFNALRTILLR